MRAEQGLGGGEIGQRGVSGGQEAVGGSGSDSNGMH